MLWNLINGESTNLFTYNNKGTVVPLWNQFSFWEVLFVSYKYREHHYKGWQIHAQHDRFQFQRRTVTSIKLNKESTHRKIHQHINWVITVSFMLALTALLGCPWLRRVQSTIRSYNFKYNEASSRISMSFWSHQPEMSMTSSDTYY